jgi:glutamate-ammonia-ligase adenylyltransferase
LDSVLTPDFFQPLPDRAMLEQEFGEHIALARDYQDFLDLSRRWANDRRFQVGVHILRQSCAFGDSCRAMTDIAEIILNAFLAKVEAEIAEKYGKIPDSRFAVIAMGKLGAREMTVGSDLDLVFLYETSGETAYSDGEKSLDATQYFARLSQRFINSLTAMTGEGRLYEIDTRLRPSGHSGPIAISLNGFTRYYEKNAWTWEFMALTRARAVAGPEDFRRAIEAQIQAILCQPRDDKKLLRDIADMRVKIEKEHPARTIWSVKFLRGGLTDLEFMAQYLLLKHAAEVPDIINGATGAVFEKLTENGLLDRETGRALIEATRLIREIQAMLRLTAGPAFNADEGTESFKAALARAAGHKNFAELRADLLDTSARVYAHYKDMIEEFAEILVVSCPSNLCRGFIEPGRL